MTASGNGAVDEDVVALAGLYQSVYLVKQAARGGAGERSAFRASIGSVFRIDADSAVSVYGGLGGVKPGLQALVEQLGRPKSRPDPELTAYAAKLMYLQQKLIALPWMVETLRAEIEAARGIAGSTDLEDPALIANLAYAYSQTISRLNPRILVHGDPGLLSQDEVANRIRALLLAGIRAAVLWRQVGGSRLRLIFGRKRIVSGAQAALSALGG